MNPSTPTADDARTTLTRLGEPLAGPPVRPLRFMRGSSSGVGRRRAGWARPGPRARTGCAGLPRAQRETDPDYILVDGTLARVRQGWRQQGLLLPLCGAHRSNAGVAGLKSWHTSRGARCSPNRMSSITAAVPTLVGAMLK